MAAAATLTVWVVVDQNDQNCQCDGTGAGGNRAVVSVALSPEWSAGEVRQALLRTVAPRLPFHPNHGVRLRNADGALLPLTPSTLASSPEQPLHLTTFRHTRYGEDGVGRSLPQNFRSTVEGLIVSFRNRLAAVEASVQDLEARRAAALQEEVRRLQDAVAFMTRRLDKTPPPAWVAAPHSLT